MLFPPTWLRRRVLAISRDEVGFERRGFVGADPVARARLELVAAAVLDGYHAALSARDDRSLETALVQVEAEQRGFAYEGAAMAMALLDRLAPWTAFAPARMPRWNSFQRGPGAAHPYMSHVGAGMALARLRRRPSLTASGFDPLLCWLVADGYGFHEGFFRWKTSSSSSAPIAKMSGYGARAFDQGLGRSLWFVCGASPQRIDATLRRMVPERWADLWSGVGLACAYAGGVGRAEISSLRVLAERFGPELAQGAAFAAQARERAGNPAAHTDLACRIVCGCGAKEAAEATVEALENLPDDSSVPAYEHWRRRIQARFGAREAA